MLGVGALLVRPVRTELTQVLVPPDGLALHLRYYARSLVDSVVGTLEQPAGLVKARFVLPSKAGEFRFMTLRPKVVLRGLACVTV